MVGQKVWAPEDVMFVFQARYENKTVRWILEELVKKYPRKNLKDTSIRYVLATYKNDAE